MCSRCAQFCIVIQDLSNHWKSQGAKVTEATGQDISLRHESEVLRSQRQTIVKGHLPMCLDTTTSAG